jgi:hypothetical protein
MPKSPTMAQPGTVRLREQHPHGFKTGWRMLLQPVSLPLPDAHPV